MDELQKLIDELKGVDQKIDALLTNESLTAEQDAERVQLQSQRKALVAKIEAEKDRLSREQERKRLETETEALKKRNESQAEAGAFRKTNAGSAAASIVIPADVRRTRVRSFRGSRNGFDAEFRAYRFGMWALAQLSIQMPQRFRFATAVEWVRANMAAASSRDASGYQNLIPEEFGTDLIDLREARGIVRRLFKIVSMGSDTRTDPRRKGGLTAYFVGENAAGTESQKTWDNVRLTAKDMMVLARFSNQLAADAVISIGDDLAAEIAYAFADKEDTCGFLGDGTSTYGGIVGVGPQLTAKSSVGIVTQGTGSTWAAIVMADFHKTVGKLPQYADTPNACWVAHRTFYYEVMQKLELATGGNTMMEVAAGDRRPRPMFLGYPVEFSQVLPSTTASAQISAFLGDFSLAASFGDRQQDDITFSEHATIGGENVFERNQIAVRGTERFDIAVHDVGDSTAPGPVVCLKTG